MSVYGLFVENIGDDRNRSILAIKEVCKLTISDIRLLLSAPRPLLLTGSKERLDEAKQMLLSRGLVASVEFYSEGIDTKKWVARISTDGIHCSKCEAELFFAVPRLTTTEQIVDFAKNSSVKNAATIISTGWIHPGAYCPNGCVCVLAEIEVAAD